MMPSWVRHDDGASRETRECPAKAVSYRLEQLLAECDPDAPEMEEPRAWQEMPAVGREV